MCVLCVCACVHVCMRVCVRACACMHCICVQVDASVHSWISVLWYVRMSAFLYLCFFHADFSAEYPPPIGTERAHKRSNSQGSPASFGQMPCELKPAHTHIHKYMYTHMHTSTLDLPPGLSPSSYRCVLVWGSTPLVLQFGALVRRPEGCIWVHLDRQCADHIWTHTCYCQVR